MNSYWRSRKSSLHISNTWFGINLSHIFVHNQVSLPSWTLSHYLHPFRAELIPQCTAPMPLQVCFRSIAVNFTALKPLRPSVLHRLRMFFTTTNGFHHFICKNSRCILNVFSFSVHFVKKSCYLVAELMHCAFLTLCPSCLYTDTQSTGTPSDAPE